MPAGRGPAERKEGLNRHRRGITAIERLSVDLRDRREVLVCDPAPPTPSDLELRLKRSEGVRRICKGDTAERSAWRCRSRDDLLQEPLERELEIHGLDAGVLVSWRRGDREARRRTFHDPHLEIEQHRQLGGVVLRGPAFREVLLLDRRLLGRRWRSRCGRRTRGRSTPSTSPRGYWSLGRRNAPRSRGCLMCSRLWSPRRGGAGSASGASMFRLIDKLHPTLLVDEADRIFRNRGGDPAADLVAQVINQGFERGTPVLRVERTSDGTQEVRESRRLPLRRSPGSTRALGRTRFSIAV